MKFPFLPPDVPLASGVLFYGGGGLLFLTVGPDTTYTDICLVFAGGT